MHYSIKPRDKTADAADVSINSPQSRLGRVKNGTENIEHNKKVHKERYISAEKNNK